MLSFGEYKKESIFIFPYFTESRYIALHSFRFVLFYSAPSPTVMTHGVVGSDYTLPEDSVHVTALTCVKPLLRSGKDRV